MKLKKLYKQLCKRAFQIDPPPVNIRFKKMKKYLGWTDWEKGRGIKGLRIRISKRLRFAENEVAVCLIHEITHMVSRQSRHNAKFYKAYFKAARTPFGRQFF